MTTNAKSKILITGGTGYIGSHTAVELIAAGHTVEILDNLYNSKKSVLEKIAQISGVTPKFHEIDLRDFDGTLKVFESGHFDAVIHFAGLKAVAESVEKPLEYYDVNVCGTVNLLRCMQKTGVKNLIFSSSATVYGGQENPCCIETMQAGHNLANPYGRTKFIIEEILRDLAAADPSFNATILRYFNPIGAHASGLLGEDPNGRPNNLMPIIMQVAKHKIPELSIYGNDYKTPDGTCIRDYIHVVDLAQGHVAALSKMHGIKIYNLGTGKGTSVMAMVKAFSCASGQPLPHKIVARRLGDLAVLYADPSLAERELRWKATKTVEDAMRDTLHFLEQQDV